MANQVVAGTNAGYDLSEEIRKQKAAELEGALASLKGAYDKSMGGLDSAEAKLPQTYEAARNEVAAQSARSARAFDERAVAAGLNTGTAGQAGLARSSTLRRDLANIGQQEANARNELDLQRAGIEADYQAALAKARAEGDASLANALYNEMVRVQELNRQDSILQAEREYAAGRDAVADKQWQDAFDYQQEQDAQAYQQWLQQMAYQKEQDALAQQNWQTSFDYGKEQDAQAYQQWLQQMAYQKEQDAIDNVYRQSVFDYEKNLVGSSGGSSVSTGSSSGSSQKPAQSVQQTYFPQPEYEEEEEDDYEAPAPTPANKYTGTNFMQDAIDAAMRGDRETAEAALAARAEKMSSPDYHGTGGGTSMEEAYAYIEQLLADSEEEATAPKPPRSTDGLTYDNGSLTREKVKEMQRHYHTAADGLWGANSTANAGGMTAEQAWESYENYKELDGILSMNRTPMASLGQANAIRGALEAGEITEDQAERLLEKYGLM